MFKKQEGITLVALVITIIVLLILAGVSISLVVGNNGVLTQASGAVKTNEKATARQEVQMAAADATTAYYTDWATDSSVEKKDYFTSTYFSTTTCPGASAVAISVSGDTATVNYTANSTQKYKFTITISTGAVSEGEAVTTF